MKQLPTKITMTSEEIDIDMLDQLSDMIANYLSNTYGYCMYDFNWDIKIEVDNINWDKEEK